MAAGLENIHISKAKSAHRQLTEHLRRQILRGDLTAGSRLPSISQLATLWGVSAFTVHTALSSLSETGLLEMRNGRGSFVAERRRELKCAAIYYGNSHWSGAEMGFYRLVHQALAKEFERHHVKIWTVMGSQDDSKNPDFLPSMKRAIQDDQIQCIVSPSLEEKMVKKIRKLGVPSVFSTNLNIAQKARFNVRELLELALDQLQHHGARRIGLIAAEPLTEEDARHEAFYRKFLEMVQERNLETRQEWIKGPQTLLEDRKHEEFARRSFFQIWSESQRPDGLVVWPDLMVRGALWGILKARVAVPQELRLALHRNEGLNVYCPFPASWIVGRPTEIARAFVEQILKQFSGEKVHPCFVSFSLSDEEGDSDLV